MGDEGKYWRDVKEHFKGQKAKNLVKAQSSQIEWTKHTDYHWSIDLQGDRLDYWPSSDKFRWRGKTRHGGVDGFIRNRTANV